MRKHGWLKYLSVLMTLVLTLAMLPANLALAAEEGEESGKVVLTSFDKLEKPEKDTFPQGTLEEDLSLPETIIAYDEEGNVYELTEPEWTIRLKSEEEEKEEEPADEKEEEYDPELTEPGEYVFTLKVPKEFDVAEDVKLPKVVLTIEPLETEPVETEPAETEYVEPETIATEAVETEYAEPETIATEAAETEYAEPETVATEAAETEYAEPETIATEAAETEYVEPETIATEAAETEYETSATPETDTIESEAETFANEVSETDGTVELLNDTPMISLVLPETMEVGKSYQLQYEISNEELANAGEASVSYSVQEGAEFIDMQDQSGYFTVLGEGTVAFQVDVVMNDSTALQAYAQGTTVPAQIVEGESEPQAEAPAEEAELLSVSVVTSDGEVLQEAPVKDFTAAITFPCDSEVDLSNILLRLELSAPVSVTYQVGEAMEEASKDEADEKVVKISADFSSEESLTVYVASSGDGPKLYTISVTKAAHIPGEMTTVTKATCTEDGLQEQKCVTCGTVLESKTITADGHTPGEWTTTKQPTCTEDGEKTQKCSVCGEILGTEVVSATGHSFGEWTVTKEATCEEKGTETRSCSVCGATETREIAALGHNWKTVKEKPATCTKDGVTSYKKCTRCGETKGKKTIKALGHDWSDWEVVEGQAPTTTSKGKEMRTCDRCGETETREVQRLNITAKAENNVIWGFTNPAKYPVNSVITFEAIGDGTDNDNPIKGDERYIPISTWNLVNDYSWGNNGYSASFRITKAGNYSLKVTFQKQIYDGSQWVSTGETAVTQQDFVIAGEGQFTDENGNGTGNTTNPDEVIGGGVKTGDNNPTIILIVVLVAAAVLLVILGVVRRKKK